MINRLLILVILNTKNYMAVYFDKTKEKFLCLASKVGSDTELIWKQNPPRSNWEDKYDNFVGYSNITRFIITSKRDNSLANPSEYTYRLGIKIFYKGILLLPFSFNEVYFKYDKQVLSSEIRNNSTLYYSINMQETSIEGLLDKAYKDMCIVCNDNVLWLYTDMLKFLDKFMDYSSSQKNSPYYIFVLAKVLKLIIFYGCNINEYFLIAGKEKLVDFVFDAYGRGTVVLENSGLETTYKNAISEAISTIKKFINLSSSL